MADVIPLDGGRAGRAGQARRRAAGAANDVVAAGAERAGGERARRRRRTTALLAGLEAAADPGQDAAPALEAAGPSSAEPAPARRALAERAPAERAPGTAPSPAEPAGSPPRARKRPPPPPPPRKRARPEPSADDVAAPAPTSATLGATSATSGPTSATSGPTSGAPADPDGDRVTALVGAAAQVGGWIAEIVLSNLAPALAEQKLASALDFLARRLTGEYEVDEFGFDPELADTVLMALARPLYRHWFRVEVQGIENIPSTGGALVVANHSGAVALDSLMTSIAVHDEHPDHRFLRMLGADLVFDTPVLSQLARKGGATLASNLDAERLLRGGEVVGVWPEGFKGIGKPFTERYKLQRFGRGGFVSAALRTSTPIIPTSIVGAEEIYPIIGNLPSVARLLGLPYLPITPTFPWLGPLGAIPLPSKWLIEFGEPVPTDELGEGAQDDPMLVFDLTDQVRQTIQQTLYSLLMQRRSVFY